MKKVCNTSLTLALTTLFTAVALVGAVSKASAQFDIGFSATDTKIDSPLTGTVYRMAPYRRYGELFTCTLPCPLSVTQFTLSQI